MYDEQVSVSTIGHDRTPKGQSNPSSNRPVCCNDRPLNNDALILDGRDYFQPTSLHISNQLACFRQRLAGCGLAVRGLLATSTTTAPYGVGSKEKEAFDLVLMDIQMPVMNGDEALAVLRDYERTTNVHLPVIALTAYALKGDVL